jgi:thiol-disulfide isomerase/thioredoxin
LIFVQYWAEWCEPCKEQMQLVDSFIQENSEVNILWLLVERDPTQMDGLPAEFHIHQENSRVY